MTIPDLVPATEFDGFDHDEPLSFGFVRFANALYVLRQVGFIAAACLLLL